MVVTPSPKATKTAGGARSGNRKSMFIAKTKSKRIKNAALIFIFFVVLDKVLLS